MGQTGRFWTVKLNFELQRLDLIVHSVCLELGLEFATTLKMSLVKTTTSQTLSQLSLRSSFNEKHYDGLNVLGRAFGDWSPAMVLALIPQTHLAFHL